MSAYIAVLLNLLLAQGSGTTPHANSQDSLTAFAPILTALTGAVAVLFLGWKNQSDINQNNLKRYSEILEQNRDLLNRDLESVKSAHDAEKRSLQLLLKQKELDIKKLKTRIKRLENFYAIDFPNLEEKDNVLEKLILFLNYTDHKVKNEIFSQEVKKVKDYLKSHLGLVDYQVLRYEASKWLDLNASTLVGLATKYIVSESSDTLATEIQEKIKTSIEQYLKCLQVMLKAGRGTESEPKFIEKTKLECDSGYVKALVYIKDCQIGGQISHSAHEELEKCMDQLIQIIS